MPLLYKKLKTIQLLRMYLYSQVLGSYSGGGSPMGRPRNIWENIIQGDAANLLLIRNWKAAARDKEEWRKKVTEAMARKQAEAP
jgi:hypothetical protein